MICRSWIDSADGQNVTRKEMLSCGFRVLRFGFCYYNIYRLPAMFCNKSTGVANPFYRKWDGLVGNL